MLAKAYLKETHVKRPKDHFKTVSKSLGIAMQSYYGGRAECRIRKIPVPVIHTDFTDEETGDEETPQWVIEAWDFLLRKELGLR